MNTWAFIPALTVLCTLLVGCEKTGSYTDDARRTSLTNAIAGRNLSRVQVLIRQHVDVNAEDSLGQVPMQVAAQSKTPAIVAALLGAGANVNGQGHWGPSPLQMSVGMSEGNAEVAKQLIEAGADVHAESGGYSVLNIAAQDASDVELKMLLDRGADPNHVEPRGTTAIYWAALNCDAAKASLLLQHGADPTRIRPSEYCPAVRALLEDSTNKR